MSIVHFLVAAITQTGMQSILLQVSVCARHCAMQLHFLRNSSSLLVPAPLILWLAHLFLMECLHATTNPHSWTLHLLPMFNIILLLLRPIRTLLEHTLFLSIKQMYQTIFALPPLPSQRCLIPLFNQQLWPLKITLAPAGLPHSLPLEQMFGIRSEE